ncbi:MAG: hypothetical protein DMF94_12190 [Acidobacteria bacterium]|nr:MAG: hypothetical protein DMF96_15585 [Acidobacteriota bacterium]PYR20354.1 MAG: hypothetical protein DMF94_12190 [Acidobacteriota bacterium]
MRGVTVEPWNSTPLLSVVVVTLPFTCTREADRASDSSASARRIPAAAIADDGFFSTARRIASSKVTRSAVAGVCAARVALDGDSARHARATLA